MGSGQRVKRVKITDFGLSKIVTSSDQVLDSCGTPAYVAPEVLLKQPYHKEVDVWALGVIMYLMVCKVLPFTTQDKRQTFKMIKYDHPNYLRSQFAMVSPHCTDLIKQMLVKDPAQRITTEDALKHPFFNILGSLNEVGSATVFPSFAEDQVEESKRFVAGGLAQIKEETSLEVDLLATQQDIKMTHSEKQKILE
jgi:serine/threonine protein kinase